VGDHKGGSYKGVKLMRIGHGYDVHRFGSGRQLIIGGVNIPNTKGLIGHSDADVLLHAICDALLGALALGDIGKHFPDTDSKYRGISSLLLLKKCVSLMREQSYNLINLDATIIAQIPKLAPHISKMRENIAGVLSCDISQINIKATTEEGLGFTGACLGVAVHCVVLISGEGLQNEQKIGFH